jgi:LuxR family maltose regulon positive regulatory protein
MLEQSSYVKRPRVEQALETAIQKPVVTVYAGAGFGKTLAVSSFLHKRNVRIVWLQLSEGDNESSRFWEKFVSGVAQLNAGAAAELGKIGFPESERQFVRHLEVPPPTTDGNHIFVFDDIHLIRNNSVLDFIRRSVTTSAPKFPAILISRVALDIDLAKIEARGQVAHITENELRFTKNEMLEYFRLLGLEPSPQTLTLIYRDTEGWAFAINLAALMLRHSNNADVYIPQSLRSNAFKLMESEIINKLSNKMRQFLIKLSLIEHLAPDLLREIAGEKNYEAIDEMERLESFIQYDTYTGAYRIHLLLLDYLRTRQNELSDDEKKQVWKLTAGWYMRNKHPMDAVSYYEKAEDYAGMAGVLVQIPLLLPDKICRRFLKILENVSPEQLAQSNPALSHLALVLRPRLLLSLGIYDRAAAECNEIISRLEQKEKKEGLTREEAALITGCYNNLGGIGLRTCGESRDYSFTRYFKQGYCYGEKYGNIDKGPHKVQPPMMVMNISSCVCRAADPGDIVGYNKMLDEMTQYTALSMGGCTCGMNDLAWAELAFFQGDFTRVEQFANTALEKAREQGQCEIAAFALAYLLRINMARGAVAAVAGLLHELDECFEQPSFVNHTVFHDLMYGFFYIQIGRPEKVAAWIKSDFEESDLNSMNHTLEIIIKAKCHLAEKRYPAVLADLESRKDKYGPWSSALGKLASRVLTAVSRYRMNNFGSALRDLETAWGLAKDNGLYMLFTEQGTDMQELAAAALKAESGLWAGAAIPKAELEKISQNAADYTKNIAVIADYFGKM